MKTECAVVAAAVALALMFAGGLCVFGISAGMIALSGIALFLIGSIRSSRGDTPSMCKSEIEITEIDRGIKAANVTMQNVHVLSQQEGGDFFHPTSQQIDFSSLDTINSSKQNDPRQLAAKIEKRITSAVNQTERPCTNQQYFSWVSQLHQAYKRKQNSAPQRNKRVPQAAIEKLHWRFLKATLFTHFALQSTQEETRSAVTHYCQIFQK